MSWSYRHNQVVLHFEDIHLQDETLCRMFNLLDEHHIKINAFRADSASYLYNVLRLIEKKVDYFYVKARMNANLAQAINIDCWEKIETATETIYRGEIQYKPFIKAP